ncbi:MAG: hypothetical protein M1825_003670 [Sarcosagium campestre]|nr:MAG: hypothetical protein M1825_003670 [Sarcosagium campestre]
MPKFLRRSESYSMSSTRQKANSEIHSRPSGSERSIIISKALSFLLRHGATKEGIHLDREGYANLAEVLNWHKLRNLNVDFNEIQAVVHNNAKQRFSLVEHQSLFSEPDPSTASKTSAQTSHQPGAKARSDPANYLIRASQGHSIRLESSSLLTPLNAPPWPTTAIHGTTAVAYRAIVATGGLSPMSRTHVHFACGLPSTLSPGNTMGVDASDSLNASPTPSVVSGFRNSSSILIYVDVRACVEAGMPWWRSENGVLLTEGLEGTGLVPMKFWDRAIVKDSKQVLWSNGAHADRWEDVLSKIVERGGRTKSSRDALVTRLDPTKHAFTK